ncbi:hypothetical protein SLEP1_g4559 [Rubroshorea leprosula]|nr:hypothetical protein SLEP1_g4559 [Rubroshorea leprosula]
MLGSFEPSTPGFRNSPFLPPVAQPPYSSPHKEVEEEERSSLSLLHHLLLLLLRFSLSFAKFLINFLFK